MYHPVCMYSSLYVSSLYCTGVHYMVGGWWVPGILYTPPPPHPPIYILVLGTGTYPPAILVLRDRWWRLIPLPLKWGPQFGRLFWPCPLSQENQVAIAQLPALGIFSLGLGRSMLTLDVTEMILQNFPKLLFLMLSCNPVDKLSFKALCSAYDVSATFT